LGKNVRKPQREGGIFFDSHCIGDILEIFAYNGIFGVVLLNDARHILPRPTPVAMATKFGTKSAITRLG